MKKSILRAFPLLILSACAALPDEDNADQEGVAQTSAAFTEAASATLTPTTNTTTKYCATVNIKNNGSYTTNSWSTVVRLNSTKRISGQNGTNGTFAWTTSQITITPNAYNTNVAPGAIANPAPSFCVSRTSTRQVPTIASASGNYCQTYYYDNDGDGYGNSNNSTYVCTNTAPTGYVANSGDCCDADANVHPGQSAYFATTNACGSFDYDCDGSSTPKSNGPTGCSDGPYTCSVINDHCVQDNSPLPAACNGNSVSYNTAACGQTWNVTATGCASGSGIPGQVICVGWGNGYPQSAQTCR